MLDQGIEEMNKLVLSVLAAIVAWFLVQHAPRALIPSLPPLILPVDQAKRKPLIPRHELEAKVGGDVTADGGEVQVDLPATLRMHNVGGRDGAGLCVFTAINHSALWQDADGLKDFQKWMRSKPGGGYPQKVDVMIKQKCKEAGVDPPQYIQIEGTDIALLDLACRTGRMPAVTYSFSPSGRYGGRHISHMVSLVHADGKNYGVLDNNYIDDLEWLSRDEFRKTFAADGGWAVILLNPAPPPPPRNKK
jgi:hypothetical protein